MDEFDNTAPSTVRGRKVVVLWKEGMVYSK